MSSNSPFPSYPDDSARNQAAMSSTALEQPPSIRTAVLLMRIGAGVALLSVVYTLVTLGSFEDDIKSDLAKADSTLSAADVDSAFTVLLVITIVLGLIGAALWLWMAWANGRGHRWARVVATVLGVLNIVSSIYSLSVGQTTVVPMILTVANLIIGLAALFYLYRPDSSQFFSGVAQPAY